MVDLKSRGLKKITRTGLTALTRKWRVNKTRRRVLLTTHGQTGDADGFTRITNRFPALTKGKIFSHVYFIFTQGNVRTLPNDNTINVRRRIDNDRTSSR